MRVVHSLFRIRDCGLAHLGWQRCGIQVGWVQIGWVEADGGVAVVQLRGLRHRD